ncbi:MAG: hypothetical protein KDI56_09590 [Xanthomonadales bacterium]|nr:hypothetical protein [Xanthomonadales bacterium]
MAALELFVGLANWTGPSSTFNTRLQTFLEAVLEAVQQIATWVSLNINPDDLPAVGEFGDALSALVGGLSDALDLFAALADTDPNVYTESTLFEDRVGNLLQSIGGTLDAFQTWILGPYGTAWGTAAQTFYTAIEAVFNTLSSALNFFIDLEESGMPPTPEIQAFVTAITDLFAAVGVQLGGLAQPNGALTLAIAAVEGVISGFPATMGTYQDAWWNAAGALAARIPAALAASVGSTATVNSLMWGIDQVMHEIVSFSGWWVPNVAVPAWYQAGVDFAQALVNGMLSLTGENGAMWNAGYALAQSGLDGFDAGAGLAGALASAMPDSIAGGWTMDTTHTWEINLRGVGSPDGYDLSYGAMDQITDMLRVKLLQGA